jgi:hypothetical protein
VTVAHYKGGRHPGLTSRAYDSCCLIYRTALERSTPVDALTSDVAALVPPNLAPEAVFVGSFFGLFPALGIASEASYHYRRTELEAMGCLRRLRHGARFLPGVWALVHPPTEELWLIHVGRPFTNRRKEQDARELHDARLGRFLVDLPTRHPELLAELVRAGCHSASSVLTYLGELPERHLRARFPGGEVCLGYDLDGARHTCNIAELDPRAPSTAEGAYKRRADHEATLTASGA